MNPITSVVIASNNAAVVIAECLSRLCQQGHGEALEIIVADASNDATPSLVKERFPLVRLLHFKQAMSVPELRGRAIALAKGQIIAILDPYSMVAPDWLEQLTRAHIEYEHPVIGGVVDLYRAESQGLLAWSQYINEYAMFMAPVEEGGIEILPGNNISYKREVLFDGDTPRFTEFWKTFVNASVTQSDAILWQTPEIRVSLWKPVPFRDFFLTRYTHGRCYAGMRCADSGVPERLLRSLSTPFLPFVFLFRWGARYWGKRRYRVKWVLTLPLQLALFSSWSLGELVGYLAGPGHCCRKLYY